MLCRFLFILICAELSGFGQGLCFIVTVSVAQFYFKKRLGFANGLVFAGSGAGLLVLTLIIERLCAEYGWQGALLIHSAILANILVCGALFRPSGLERQMIAAYKASQNSTPHQEDQSNDGDKKLSSCFTVCRDISDAFALSSLLKNRLYVVFAVVSIVINGAYMSSSVFVIPMLVYDAGLSRIRASLVFSVFGACSIVSGSLHGLLIDYKLVTVTNLYLLSLVVCGTSVLLFPPVMSVEGQFALAGTYGLGAGVMTAMAATMCRQYVSIDKVSNALGLLFTVAIVGLLLGTQMMGKCIGYVCCLFVCLFSCPTLAKGSK